MKCRSCKKEKCECFYTCLTCYEHAGNCKCLNEEYYFKKISPKVYEKLNEGNVEPDEKVFN